MNATPLVKRRSSDSKASPNTGRSFKGLVSGSAAGTASGAVCGVMTVVSFRVFVEEASGTIDSQAVLGLAVIAVIAAVIGSVVGLAIGGSLGLVLGALRQEKAAPFVGAANPQGGRPPGVRFPWLQHGAIAGALGGAGCTVAFMLIVAVSEVGPSSELVALVLGILFYGLFLTALGAVVGGFTGAILGPVLGGLGWERRAGHAFAVVAWSVPLLLFVQSHSSLELVLAMVFLTIGYRAGKAFEKWTYPYVLTTPARA